MNAEIKKLWIEALRSGDYKQGKGVLRSTDDHFCCLGVLCDLYEKKTGDSVWSRYTVTRYQAKDQSSTLIPPEIARWAGLPDRLIVNQPGILEQDLIYANDQLDYSFDKIASIIEADNS